MPAHFDPTRVASLWVERTGLLAEEAARWAKEHDIRPAQTDEHRVALFAIDCQVSFCHPDAALYVPGAVEDTVRALKWFYTHMGRITEWVVSLDTHELHQIFHPAFWRSEHGSAPSPFTTITAQDVRTGKWVPRGEYDACLDYLDQLESTERYVLTIWPYHGLLGAINNALMPSVSEAIYFHSFARDTAPRFIVKGRQPLTEMYSVLAPEVTEVGGQNVGGFDEELLKHLLGFDEIYVFGQASSHCVLATLEDVHKTLATTYPSQLSKFIILEDAMSPVPAPPLDPLPDSLNFPFQAQIRMDKLVEAGMRKVRTSDLMT